MVPVGGPGGFFGNTKEIFHKNVLKKKTKRRDAIEKKKSTTKNERKDASVKRFSRTTPAVK